MSLSFSDISEKKSRNNSNRQTKQNGEKRKTNRLGDLLGASNVRAPEGRGIPNYNPVQQHSANLNVFQQQNNNMDLDNDGYNVLSPASIPDVNEGLEADMSKVMNNTSNNPMQQNSMPQNMNIQSNLPPYMQKELNRINPNLMQGQMNGQMPMNSAMLDMIKECLCKECLCKECLCKHKCL